VAIAVDSSLSRENVLNIERADYLTPQPQFDIRAMIPHIVDLLGQEANWTNLPEIDPMNANSFPVLCDLETCPELPRVRAACRPIEGCDQNNLFVLV
jgi:hypothetical protein